VIDVLDSEVLIARFGRWPSFHDAEVLAVRLDSGRLAEGRPSIELDIHLFAVDGTHADGTMNYAQHTLATIRFEDTGEVEIEAFGPQNVLDDLLIEAADSPRSTRVTLPSNNGLSAEFTCQRVSIVAVTPFTPGPHSVYHRQSE